tara:strand:- start:4425 stop:5027 length:603 start_codon:yes stop_codon:yes gene_type:complete
MLPVIGMSLLGSAFSGMSANKRASRMRSQAIKDAKYQSPEELAWIKKTQQRSIYGDENFEQKKNLALQPIKSMGQQTKQQAVGQAIRQGLENSVIANEIRSRMDAKTQTQMSQVAKQIALMNEQYKDQQEQALDKYHLGRADRIRNITSQANQSYLQNQVGGLDILGGFMSQLASTGMGTKGFQDSQFMGWLTSGNWTRK